MAAFFHFYGLLYGRGIFAPYKAIYGPYRGCYLFTHSIGANLAVSLALPKWASQIFGWPQVGLAQRGKQGYTFIIDKLLFLRQYMGIKEHTMPEDLRYSPFGRKYQPKKLSERYHRILRLNLLGYKEVDIARALGVSKLTVSTAINSNLGRYQTSILRAECDGSAVEAAKRIREIAPKAIRLIEEIIESEDAPTSVRLRAAQDALDRAGFGAVKKVDMRTTSISLTPDDLENLKQTALERAKASGLIVEANESGPAQHLELE